jgi:copper chaperone CopZ
MVVVEEIPAAGIRTKGRTMTTTEYQVTGMTCGHCEMSVREEVGLIAGVDEIQVSAATGSLVVTSAVALDDAAVIAAVDEAGYAAVRA